MFESTLLGGLLGGIFRLVPEVLKFVDRKDERKHELQLLAANLEADKARYSAQLAQTTMETNASMFTQSVSALEEALKGQFQLTGIQWVDALNMTVRPVITYSFFAMFAVVKVSALLNGAPLSAVWTEGDAGLFAGILNFYFLGRVFERRASAA
jgi:hypothetical protein